MDTNWWNNALQSYDVGREHRADRENAQAFQTGGYGAVEQAAGNRGDMQTAMTTRRFQDDDRQRAYDRMETIAPRARGLIRAARNMANQNPEQARQFLGGYANMFTDFGFTPEQVQAGIAGLTSENPEERTQWADTLDQAFQQHQDPNWEIKTMPTAGGGYEQRAIGVGQDGFIQQGPNAIAGAGSGFRPITEQERQQYNIPASVPAQVEIATGRVHTMLGRPAQGRAGAGQYPDDGYDYVEE